ncbi:S41 family peptidase [uncultured Helcococcus sp.]|uniref:S41 family peptidase n=1 Tax=uncultured Helcococcus sp. TaxID=1072508 RepID=UPI00288AA432|nr:S41 family peptidase [uncultured Helcococcus sp.]
MNKKVKGITLALILGLVSVFSFGLGKYSRSFDNNVGVDSTISNEKILTNIDSIVDNIDKNYIGDIDKEKMETGIYKGILSSLDDPYSVYFNEEEFKSLMEDTQGEFGGIGIQVTASSNGFIEVVAPIKDTPGDKAGIQPGDYITHINGEKFAAEDLEKAVKVMRGEAGSEVNITLLRGKGTDQEVLDLEIKREIISVQTVHSKMLEENIGYVLLTGFQEKSAKDFIAAVEDLKAKGAKSLVFDLRNNPGGLLNVAQEIADYLLDDGVVISVKYKDDKNNEEIRSKDGKMDLHMTVLINKGSASASEVLSGALQDNNRAKLVGETSFGKGVIQQIYPVFNNGKKEGIKLTVAEFFTPNGNKIHGEGIKPDYPVELSKEVKIIGPENIEEDKQLKKAIELLK